MALLTLLISVIAATAALPSAEPLTLLRTVELPGVRGRIDHLAVDVSTGHLFVAALGNDTVEVIDGRAGTWLRRQSGFHDPQGIASMVAFSRSYRSAAMRTMCAMTPLRKSSSWGTAPERSEPSALTAAEPARSSSRGTRNRFSSNETGRASS